LKDRDHYYVPTLKHHRGTLFGTPKPSPPHGKAIPIKPAGLTTPKPKLPAAKPIPNKPQVPTSPFPQLPTAKPIPNKPQVPTTPSSQLPTAKPIPNKSVGHPSKNPDEVDSGLTGEKDCGDPEDEHREQGVDLTETNTSPGHNDPSNEQLQEDGVIHSTTATISRCSTTDKAFTPEPFKITSITPG
ncbi:unnamed protein product, partial [Allacma fusca]